MTPEEQNAYQLAVARMAAQRAATDAQAKHPPAGEPMGWGIFLVALLLGLIADLLEIFTFGTFGWLTGLFIDVILFLMLGITKAGRKQFKRWMWGPIIEKIPFLNTLPLIRAGFLVWSFVVSRHPGLKPLAKI